MEMNSKRVWLDTHSARVDDVADLSVLALILVAVLFDLLDEVG